MNDLQMNLNENSTGGLMTKKWPYFLFGLFLSVLFCLIILFFENSSNPDSNFNPAYPVPDLIFNNAISGEAPSSEIHVVNSADSLLHETALDSIRAWAQRIDTLNAQAWKPSFYQHYGYFFRWLGIFLPILIFLLFEWYRFEQRKSLKKQLKCEPSLPRAGLEIPELNFLKSEQFRSIIKKFKQPPNSSLLQSPNTAAIDNEAQEFENIHPIPEPAYIVLIDRLSNQDHYARLAEMVVNTMKQAGLNVDYYFYENDPRHCYKGEVYNWVYLNDLRVKYSDHRLIMIGNGKGLIESHSNNFVDWIELLFSWKERAILSTREPASWGDAEQLLSREFILLPASMDGLAALADHFDEPARLDMKIWKNGHRESFKLDLDGEPDISQLKTYLGEEGFEWLCACAVYSELYWPLTLQLEEIIRFSEKEFTEKKLLHLIRLDWFQTGKIPDNWREVLIEHFNSERLASVRQKLIHLLEKGSFSSEPGDQSQHNLDLVTQKWLMDRENPHNRHQLRFAIQEAHKNEIEIDKILFKQIEKPPGISSMLPAFLRNWIFDQGIPILGIKQSIAAGLAILVALVAFISIPAAQIPINLTLQHHHAINGALLDQAENQILTWSDDQTAVLWDIPAGAPVFPPIKHEAAVRGAKFSDDEDFILTWTGDENQQKGSIYIWKKADGQPAFPPIDFAMPVKQVEFSIKDSMVLALQMDSTLNFWKIKKDQLVPRKFAGDSIKFSRLILNKTKSQIFGFTNQNEFCIWNYKTGIPIFNVIKQIGQISGVQFFHNDSHFIYWSADSTIRFYDVKRGQSIGAILKHDGAIQKISISPDDSFMLSWTSPTANLKSRVYLWDLKTGKQMADPLMQNEEFQGAIFLKDNSKIVTWTLSGSIQLWAIENGMRPIKTFLVSEGVPGIQMSTDERRLMAWDETGNVYCWNLDRTNQNNPVMRLHHPVNGACWSQKHEAILAWSQGGTAKFVQIAPLLAYSMKKISRYPEVIPLGNYDINGRNLSPKTKLTPIKKEYRPFVIGRYEISNAQFVQFLNEKWTKATPSWLQADPILTRIKQVPSGQFIVEPGFENYPVVGVNWSGANAYCEWLAEKTKIPFRLPTEAEWRYATATEFTNFTLLPVGQYEDYGWFETNAASGPRAIGEKNPNILGLYDLQGNLWEWCADSVVNGLPETEETIRMTCGGAWNSNLKELEKNAWRKFENTIPENNNSIGFRIVAAFSPDASINHNKNINKQSQKKHLKTISDTLKSENFTKSIETPADEKLIKNTESEIIEQNLTTNKEKMAETVIDPKKDSKVIDLPVPVEQKKNEPAKRSAPRSDIKVGILEETAAAKQKSQSTGIDDILNRKSEIAFDIKQQMPTESADDKTKKLAGGRIGMKDAGNTPFGGKEQLPETGGSTSVPGRAGEKISLTNNGSNDQNGATTETTGRDFNSIFPVIKRHQASINYCYERELKRNPNLKGKVVVRFTVSPKGNVSEVTVVSSTLNSDAVQQCIVSRISRWNDFGEVDASKGDATFRHVYVFGY
ncbi:SUMF1/EgtB/PvdO family nonheme iron enzyme [candidate division KSB1 bacterium]|nr:SUMF1/EgtB/PvdO family nonheme iron enzyme [candidate division KSB1 bacterium]